MTEAGDETVTEDGTEAGVWVTAGEGAEIAGAETAGAETAGAETAGATTAGATEETETLKTETGVETDILDDSKADVNSGTDARLEAEAEAGSAGAFAVEQL